MSECYLFFFFFKQKTAYEMRISDWSSDVCSSDLVREDGPHPHLHRHQPHPHGKEAAHAAGPGGRGGGQGGQTGARIYRRRRVLGRGCGAFRQDRKSVVEGKSVSVRVDLGGRRIIKKKKKKQVNGYND